MSHDIVIRFTDDEAAALQKRKDETLVPMSQFIRLAVRNELAKTIVDADSEPKCVPESISLPAPVAIKIAESKQTPKDANIHTRLARQSAQKPPLLTSNFPVEKDGEQ